LNIKGLRNDLYGLNWNISYYDRNFDFGDFWPASAIMAGTWTLTTLPSNCYYGHTSTSAIFLAAIGYFDQDFDIGKFFLIYERDR
jgi:hypothetical protein